MKLSFLASSASEALEAKTVLTKQYPHVMPEEADVIVALGGDGFMLETMHAYLDNPRPIFGVHCGSVGFLMNTLSDENLIDRISQTKPTTLYPLHMKVVTQHNEVVEGLAFNEVSLLRESRQAAKIQISVDKVVRLEEVICDGVLVATPAGSTAYNLSANGPIIPLGAPLLALTPISPFRPHRWRGALLPDSAEITFAIHEPEKRPVSAVADFMEVRDVVSVAVRQTKMHHVTLLFDYTHNLDERILREQFLA